MSETSRDVSEKEKIKNVVENSTNDKSKMHGMWSRQYLLSNS